MKDNKTMLLQLFAEEEEVATETTEEVAPEQPTETVDTAETTEKAENDDPVSYRDLEYKYKDEKGKLSDYAPEDVIKNFQLGKKYQEHEADIDLTKRLKELYGVKTTQELDELFNQAMDQNIRESAPEGIPEDQLDEWVEFQKMKRAEDAKAPEREREATMASHVEALKAKGRIKSISDIPDTALEIYKNRGYSDLEGAIDSYELEQTKIRLKESENAASSPGSLKDKANIPKQKAVKDMSKSEYEAYKESRRAIAAQANGG